VSKCCVWGALFASGLGAGSMLTGCSRSARPDSANEPISPSARAVMPAAAPRVERGVAVVELFTSEGCSSCPPADRNLARLSTRAGAEALPVYPLSFHVDYWNYLGWRDRFSSANFSERQQKYGWIQPTSGIYTPQAVVNGRAETVGSNATQIDALVSAALAQAPRAFIALEAKRSATRIDVSYRVSGEVTDRVLNLALVEPHVESAVRSGENAGERLAHTNVVRSFATRSLAAGAAGNYAFVPDADLAGKPLRVVAYVESASQRDVTGASELELD